MDNSGVYLDSNTLNKIAENIYNKYNTMGRTGIKYNYPYDFQTDYDILKILSDTLPAGYYNLNKVPFPKIQDKSTGSPVDILPILKHWEPR